MLSLFIKELPLYKYSAFLSILLPICVLGQNNSISPSHSLFDQTNTIVIEDYWTSVNEFPYKYHSLKFENFKFDSDKDLIGNPILPICINVLGENHSALNLIDSQIIKRVKGLSIFLQDTNFSLIKQYTDKFKAVEFLHIVILSNSSINHFPFDYCNPTILKAIAINGNLSAIHKDIAKLKHLEYIQIGSDSLRFVSQEISKLTRLRSLYLTGDMGLRHFFILPPSERMTLSPEPRVNISSANICRLPSDELNFELPELQNLVLILKSEPILKLSKSKYYQSLCIYPGWNPPSKIAVNKVIYDRNCSYKNLIINELITDSLNRLSNLNHCIVFKLYTGTETFGIGQYSSDIIFNNSKINNTSLSVHHIYFGQFNLYFIGNNTMLVDYSYLPYFKLNQPIPFQWNSVPIKDSFNCFEFNEGNITFDTRVGRNCIKPNVLSKYIDLYSQNINRISIDTMDNYSKRILDSCKFIKLITYNNPTKEGVKFISKLSQKNNLIWLILVGKNKLDNTISKNIANIGTQNLILQMQLNLKSLNVKTNSRLSSFYTLFLINNLKLKFRHDQVLQNIQIAGGNISVKKLGVACRFGVSFREKLQIRFSDFSYIEDFEINNSKLTSFDFKYQEKSPPIITKLRVKNLSSKMCKNLGGLMISELQIDSVVDQVDFSIFNHVEILSISHIDTLIDQEALIMSINKINTLKAVRINNEISPALISHIRKDIRVIVGADYFLNNITLLGQNAIEIIEDSNKPIKDTFAYNPNFTIFKQ